MKTITPPLVSPRAATWRYHCPELPELTAGPPKCEAAVHRLLLNRRCSPLTAAITAQIQPVPVDQLEAPP